MSETHAPPLPPVPTTRDDLLISALRCANDMGGLLNELSAEVFRMAGDEADDPKWERMHDLLRRRFTDCSGVHLFIAADNLRIDLPPDLQGEPDEDATDG